MIVKKKVFHKYFKKILNGDKNWEFRLNDFKINKGDTLELIEIDDKTKNPTGRVIRKIVSDVTRFNPTDFYKIEDIRDKGVQIISFK